MERKGRIFFPFSFDTAVVAMGYNLLAYTCDLAPIHWKIFTCTPGHVHCTSELSPEMGSTTDYHVCCPDLWERRVQERR